MRIQIPFKTSRAPAAALGPILPGPFARCPQALRIVDVLVNTSIQSNGFTEEMLHDFGSPSDRVVDPLDFAAYGVTYERLPELPWIADEGVDVSPLQEILAQEVLPSRPDTLRFMSTPRIEPGPFHQAWMAAAHERQQEQVEPQRPVYEHLEVDPIDAPFFETHSPAHVTPNSEFIRDLVHGLDALVPDDLSAAPEISSTELWEALERPVRHMFGVSMIITSPGDRGAVIEPAEPLGHGLIIRSSWPEEPRPRHGRPRMWIPPLPEDPPATDLAVWRGEPGLAILDNRRILGAEF